MGGEAMGTESGDSSPLADWEAFALDVAAYTAERHVRTLVEGVARVAESLGHPFSPAS